MCLVFAMKRQPQFVVDATQASDGQQLTTNGELSIHQRKVTAFEDQTSTDLCGSRRNDLSDNGILFSNNHQAIGLDDASLFASDLFQC